MLYWLLRHLLGIFLKPIFRIEFKNIDLLPEKGPAIIASNHKSWLDPVIIGIAARRKVRFIAKAELFKIPLLNSLITSLGAFPVKRGAADIGALKTSIKILKTGDVLGIFVEGTRVKQEGIGELKPGIYAIAKISQAPVIICAIRGTRPLFKRRLLPFPNKIKLKFESFEIDPRTVAEEEYLRIMKNRLERMYNELGD
ncbi:MAG: 1-acyl-sn-glycerol-3-phosphate acyltransferase [Actinobacteria bacterium]|nr:1-acyl-sn-glycerol-3-phosphate acyltransferase [Actinomycetota bacterium]